MEQRELGRTGVRVSAIGLGCAGMSEGYGTPNDAESLETLSQAVANGVNFFDTSDVYGAGRGEELLGQFLKQQPRDAVVVATKFGLVLRPGVPPVVDNSPDYVRTACENSLRRLGVDTIDLYYVHRRNPEVPIEDVVGAMAELVRAGKVRALGLSEVSPDTLRRAMKVHPITAVQSEYSLWSRGAEKTMLDVCQELGVTFVAYCPLGRGMLTGKVNSLNGLEANDFRRRLPRFADGALENNLALVRKLDAFATRYGATHAQIALAWLLCKHPHVVPIPGTKRVRYALENAAATRVKLPPGEISQLDELFMPSAVTGDRYPPPAMRGIEET